MFTAPGDHKCSNKLKIKIYFNTIPEKFPGEPEVEKQVHKKKKWVCNFTGACTHTHTHTHTHTCPHMRTHPRMCTIHTHTHTLLCTHIHTHTCSCAHTYTHTHTHTSTHTHHDHQISHKTLWWRKFTLIDEMTDGWVDACTGSMTSLTAWLIHKQIV